MRIKIKDIPLGDPPEWVRQAWLGIELESIGRNDLNDLSTLIGRQGYQNLGGYMVFGEVAFQALQLHNKDAYIWWMINSPQTARKTLVFSARVCEVLP